MNSFVYPMLWSVFTLAVMLAVVIALDHIFESGVGEVGVAQTAWNAVAFLALARTYGMGKFDA